MNEVANFFWHGHLPELQKSCIKSFIKNGFDVILWSYENHNVSGALSKDANEILIFDDIKKYSYIENNKNSNITAFSDVFRYKLLNDTGSGWWFDCDCYCLKTVEKFSQLKIEKGKGEFIVGKQKDGLCNNAVLYSDEYTSKFLYKECIDNIKENMKWGDLGPTLITYFSELNFSKNILDFSYFYSIDWTESDVFLDYKKINKGLRMIKNSYITHVWNSSINYDNNDNNLISLLIKNKL